MEARRRMGEPEGETSERALRIVAALLESKRVPYAIIGGLAVQLHSRKPRTEKGIDVALRSHRDIPRQPLLAAGFKHLGTFADNDRWLAPGPVPRQPRTPVQFIADTSITGALERARFVSIGDLQLRVVTALDLLQLKFRAAEDATRKPSQRATDVADILRLTEDRPGLKAAIPDAVRGLARIQARILGLNIRR